MLVFLFFYFYFGLEKIHEAARFFFPSGDGVYIYIFPFFFLSSLPWGMACGSWGLSYLGFTFIFIIFIQKSFQGLHLARML